MRRWLAPAGLALLTLALTLPLWFAPLSSVPAGDGLGDAFQFLWNLWWTGGALHGNHALWHTNLLHWPETTPLAFHTLTPANGLLSLPIQALVPGPAGLVLALNLLTILSFFLTALAARALAREHGATELGAFAAGALAASLPYRLWHINHLNLLSTYWGLWTLLCLWRALRRGTWPWIVATALCAALLTYSDYEGALATVLLSIGMLGWRLWALRRDPGLPRVARTLAWTAALALLLHLPLLMALLQPGAAPVPPTLAKTESLSANLLGLLLPGPGSMLHQGWANALLPSSTQGLAGDEVGQGLLFLPLLGWLLLRRETPRAARLWALAGALLLLLALGPTLQVGPLRLLQGWMPLAWLRKAVPMLGISRAPVRMLGLGGMTLAIAFGLALPKRNTLAGLLLLLVLLERLPATPPKTQPVRVPQAIAALAQTPQKAALLQLPTGYFHRQVYMFWQTEHGHPTTTGWTARLPKGMGELPDRFARLQGQEAQQATLRRARIGYVVLAAPDPRELLRGEPRVIPLDKP